MENHIRFDLDSMTLFLLDQRYLPAREEFHPCTTSDACVHAIKEMVVRGAPAIGVTAAWACVLALTEVRHLENWEEELATRLDTLQKARPTAVNLRWAVERMRSIQDRYLSGAPSELLSHWLWEAQNIQNEDIRICQRIGKIGAACIPQWAAIMTHCNAGALATAGYGTALGVIRAAWEAGKDIRVIANETRPFLQGARLTAYEMVEDGIPVTVACDNACGLLMHRGLVTCVVVGADRIAANGDTANKIGTYAVAVLAKAHNVPFYVAAPLSTIDPRLHNGDAIPIEVRPAQEVTHIGDTHICPGGISVYNFAFDVTPADYISGIITEAGILRAPYTDSIAEALAAPPTID